MKQLPKRGQPVTVRLMSRNQTDLKSGARWGHEAKVRVKVRAQAQAQEQAEAKAKWVRAQQIQERLRQADLLSGSDPFCTVGRGEGGGCGVGPLACESGRRAALTAGQLGFWGRGERWWTYGVDHGTPPTLLCRSPW